ncbi:DnaB-like helicase N-terminal domain-containing protein [Nostoc sp. NMS9]|uniref:DnaB-like helicase N-terminal domain-containing protein n=1 Tax=Nostoc sp. NMS9 TaxID=2815393 RepID=UPI0025EBDA83|nr:DnaB-like helicase N-terminal domain-containing protein [Nostoc sp. NMS9]MBN3943490.1 AAA family ATPase [Nostoc sp. NMS9]
MVLVPYSYTEEPNFKPVEHRLPPCKIEHEEAVLGGILLDPNAIYRVKDRLEPEHFYIGAHQDIYKACLRLSKKALPTDLLHVSSWLLDHNLLARIGGRNKLASLVDRTVSAVNIDSLALSVIEVAERRGLLKTGNEFIRLAYETETDWSDIRVVVENKTQSIIGAPLAPTKEQNQLWHYNQLINELENIYLKTSDPGLKLFKLQELANSSPGRRVKDLEDLYMKSLCATVEPRKSLDELEEEVGSEERKWLLGGILAQATTALVIADGGVGKTKWLYDLLHCIASGQNWNNFPATADSRRVLIYQGDESKNDMLQALNKRGFKPGTEVRQSTAVRFGWNTDAMPILYQDAAEFRPSIVMIDSLTFVNRYSLYDENRTEYSRPVLELNKFAAETGITVVIVHHTNKNGGSRGTTAVRNAVSEVIKLEKDPNPSANPQEKILTIEKSRSRRFPTSYRLFFNEEDFSFSLLEEVGLELGSPDLSTKDQIIKFLQEHANVKYQAEEIAHYLKTTTGNARRCLGQLARDGLVILDERSFSGTAKLYYIARESDNCSTENPLQTATVTSSQRITFENDSILCQSEVISESPEMYKNDGSPCDHLMITLTDHLLNNSVSHTEQEALSNCNEGDHLSMPEIAVLPNSESEKKIDVQTIDRITFAGNAEAVSNPEGDPVRRSQGDHEVIRGDRDRLDDNSGVLQPKLSELGFKIKDTIRITACPGRPELIGREETIARMSDKTIRTESALFFARGEFEKCSPSKSSRSFTSLQIGEICHCSLHNKKAKIQKIIVTKAEAEVILAGDIDVIRVKLSDLTALTWQPMLTQPAMYGSELVMVVGYDSAKRQYQIETSTNRTYYVKASKLSNPNQSPTL